VEQDALAGLSFESGQIRQLADGPVDRNRIGLGEAEWAGAVRVFIVGRGRLQHRLHRRMNEFQLKRFVIEDAVDVRHCFA